MGFYSQLTGAVDNHKICVDSYINDAHMVGNTLEAIRCTHNKSQKIGTHKKGLKGETPRGGLDFIESVLPRCTVRVIMHPCCIGASQCPYCPSVIQA